MCFLHKCVISTIRNNFFLILGLFLGVALSSLISQIIQNQCVFISETEHFSSHEHSKLTPNDEYEPVINLAAKPLKAQKIPKDFQRPRYYKTELGIRDKLLAAILTSPTTIMDYGVASNSTTNHLFDKVVFFMESEPNNSKSDVRWNGVVQFSDSRLALKPFHMLKYIIDNFLDDFDYFLLVRDKTYIRGREFYNLVHKISVSETVHAGVKHSAASNYCSLDAGILLSNLVLQKISLKLDWCIKNAFHGSDDVNVGGCIVYSSGVTCTSNIQGLQLSSFKLNASLTNIDFDKMENEKSFNDALTFWPVRNSEMLLKLHAYFSKVDVLKRKREISMVRKKILNQPVILPDNTEIPVSWPVGTPQPLRPLNRFDLLRWDYFTESKIFLKSDYSNVDNLTGADLIDVKNVINASVVFIENKYGKKLEYKRLLNGYRRFDPSRGMDYILDLRLQNLETGSEISKRIEVCKPLGKVELIPMPYVTENTRINMVVVVDENSKKEIMTFINYYVTVCMEKREKTSLILVLLYGAHHPGKGSKDDIFAEVKGAALKHSDRFRRDSNKITWLSIKLPEKSVVTSNIFPHLKGISLGQGIMKIIALDLVVRKFSSDHLMLYCTSNMEIRQDYLNRVRMNTVREHQVFSPIPFSEYDPNIVYNEELSRPKEMDVNRNYGHYDSMNTDHISFYVKDYKEARKTVEQFIPVMHTDRDIAEWILYLEKKLEKSIELKHINSSIEHLSNTFLGHLKKFSLNSVYAVFVGYKSLHVLRAVEPGLRLRHTFEDCSRILSGGDIFKLSLYEQCIEKRNFNSGGRGQLAQFILEYMHGCNGV